MDKTDFFDRRVYLDILNKRTKAIKDGYRQNIAIIGDKDIGKTSMVLHFLNQLDDPIILPQGGTTTFRALTTASIGRSSGTIKHYNFRRAITVEADLGSSDEGPGALQRQRHRDRPALDAFRGHVAHDRLKRLMAGGQAHPKVEALAVDASDFPGPAGAAVLARSPGKPGHGGYAQR